MRKSILVCTALMMIALVPAAMAVTVDGYKEVDEWSDDWAFAQTHGTGYDPNGPFGDRLVMYQNNAPFWFDIDPIDDAGTGFNDNLATVGPADSGSDIKTMYVRLDGDTLYGLCEVYGIPGDLDGNGDIASDPMMQDTAGNVGPDGQTGIGDAEYWEVRVIQGTSESRIWLQDNQWTVDNYGGTTLTSGDVYTYYNSVYEISISNLDDRGFDFTPGAQFELMIIAGAVGDVDPITGGVLGEDISSVFVCIPDPEIDIVKYVKGNDGVWYDANTPATGPVMANGSAVSWKYEVTNTGNEPLKDVVVTDDQGVAVTCPQDTLNASESMTCTATGTVPDPCVPYKNIGDVKGVGVVSGIEVADMDPAHYLCRPDVPALTPAGLMALIGILGMIGIVGLKRRD